MSVTRILLVGCGNISKMYHEGFLKHPDEIRLVGVSDPNESAAKVTAQAVAPDARVFVSAMEAVQTLAGEVDGVIVTTPHFLHHPIAAACLKSNMSVLVEKPVVCSLDELRSLQELEKKHGGFVQAGQMQRYGYSENWIQNWMKSEKFGEPHLFNLEIYQNIWSYVGDRTDMWILDKKRAGGGIATSVGIHILDLLRFWTGQDYVEVIAQGRFDRPFSNGAESMVTAILNMSNGLSGTLTCSYSVARTPHSQRALVFGNHGTLCQHLDAPGAGYAGQYFISTDEGQPTKEWGLQYAGFKKVNDFLPEENVNEPFPHLFTKQTLSFARGIRTGAAEKNSLQENFNTIAVLEALAESISQNGSAIKVQTK